MNDDFENRLGQGLKRWAEAGETTVDLEAYVTGHAKTVSRRPWLRWAGAGAAAAVLLFGIFFSFPAWAGTAAEWPVVGPVIREIIMKDAGLKWAYDAGLMNGTLAEASEGGVTVRILGVSADTARTTVLYQITGTSATGVSSRAGKPIPAGTPDGLWSSLARPAAGDAIPSITVLNLPGTKSFMVSSGMPMETPVGLVGTFTTNPIGDESGTMILLARVDGHAFKLSFPVSRSQAARLSREIPVHQIRQAGGVTYTIDAIIQTPVETGVRYQVDKTQFRGDLSWPSPHAFGMALYQHGQPVWGTLNYGDERFQYAVFPKVEKPERIAVQAEAVGQPAQLEWPLTKGAVQQANGVTITLTQWGVRDGELAVEWQFRQTDALLSFAGFEAVDAAGQVHELKRGPSTWTGPPPDHDTTMTYQFTLPDGVQPVAIRATQIAVTVPGPWVFDLPAK